MNSFMFNSITGEYECSDNIDFEKDLKRFLPEEKAVYGLYDCYIKMGKNHVEAFNLTLGVYLGEAKICVQSSSLESSFFVFKYLRRFKNFLVRLYRNLNKEKKENG